MIHLKKATLFNALTRETELWRKLQNHDRNAAFINLIKETPHSNLLNAMYGFFNVDNCEPNASNTEQKATLLDGILRLMELKHSAYTALAHYPQTDSQETELAALQAFSLDVAKLEIEFKVNNVINALYKDAKEITDKLERSYTPYFTGWLGRHLHNVGVIREIILCGDINSKTNKLRLNKLSMRAIMEYTIEATEESRALYDIGIDIINFDLCTKAFYQLLNVLYDDITNDYIDTFLYDHDCCRTSIMEIEWEDGGFTIGNSDSLVDYLDKYVYAAVL